MTITGLFWIVGSLLWEKWSRTNRKRLMVIVILGYALTLASFALLADWAKATPGNAVVLYWELFALRARWRLFLRGDSDDGPRLLDGMDDGAKSRFRHGFIRRGER